MTLVKQWVFEQPATAWDPALFSWWLLGSRQPQIQLSKNSPFSVSCVNYSWLVCVIFNMQAYIVLNLLHYTSGHWGTHFGLRVVTGEVESFIMRRFPTYTSDRILFGWTDQGRSDGQGKRRYREEKCVRHLGREIRKKIQPGRPRYKWKDNIKMYLKGLGWKVIDCLN